MLLHIQTPTTNLFLNFSSLLWSPFPHLPSSFLTLCVCGYVQLTCTCRCAPFSSFYTVVSFRLSRRCVLPIVAVCSPTSWCRWSFPSSCCLSEPCSHRLVAPCTSWVSSAAPGLSSSWSRSAVSLGDSSLSGLAVSHSLCPELVSPRAPCCAFVLLLYDQTVPLPAARPKGPCHFTD